MQTSAWISLALAALLPSSAIAFDASAHLPARGGPMTLDRLTLVEPGSTGPVGDMCAPAKPGTSCRSLKDWAGDQINVMDYGAKMDGITDDLPAFNRARAAAGVHGVIYVPPGAVKLSDAPTAGSDKPLLWRLSGNKTPGGAPITGTGTDMVETVAENSVFYGQDFSTHLNSPLLRINQRITHSFHQRMPPKNRLAHCERINTPEQSWSPPYALPRPNQPTLSRGMRDARPRGAAACAPRRHEEARSHDPIHGCQPVLSDPPHANWNSVRRNRLS